MLTVISVPPLEFPSIPAAPDDVVFCAHDLADCAYILLCTPDDVDMLTERGLSLQQFTRLPPPLAKRATSALVLSAAVGSVADLSQHVATVAIKVHEAIASDQPLYVCVPSAIMVFAVPVVS